MKDEPVACSDHHYEKLNASTIFCPGCGDMKTAPVEVGPYVLPPTRYIYSPPRCAYCGQPLWGQHYHVGDWPSSPWTVTTGTTWTSGKVTISTPFIISNDSSDGEGTLT